MTYVVYGLKQTRITLYDADGVTAKYRITFQKEMREGLTLSYKPEGVSHQLGSAANWATPRTHRGFRAHLDIKWDYGLESSVETWNGTAWDPPVSTLTAEALSLVFTWAFEAPCVVEPHLDKGYAFHAQPDPGRSLDLSDVKGVAHKDLGLTLIQIDVGPIPVWSTL